MNLMKEFQSIVVAYHRIHGEVAKTRDLSSDEGTRNQLTLLLDQLEAPFVELRSAVPTAIATVEQSPHSTQEANALPSQPHEDPNNGSCVVEEWDDWDGVN